MSAPRFFSRLRFALLAMCCALVVGGCTVPGKGRLEGPPKDLPPSMDLVTADLLGYALVDTDADSKLWAPLEGVTGGDGPDLVLGGVHEDVFGDDPGVDAWIGDHAGIAVRQLALGDDDVAAQAYFADVAKRAKLEAALEDAGWERGNDSPPAPAGEGAAWTRGDGAWRAAAVTDDALLVAHDTKQLETFLKAADEYAVPERKAMREFTVEAAKRSPAAFVFRSDLLRTQVRRPFEGDPATLEFARWATDSNVLVALRDGWVGAAPALEEGERDDHLRVVGAAEWVPDLAPDITLGAAKPDLLARLDPASAVAVAIDDPGEHLRELVRAITLGAGQYVTEEDVPKDEDRMELLPLLDRLDGNAAIGVRPGALEFVFEDDERLREDVLGALDHAGVDAAGDAAGVAGASKVTIPLEPERGHAAPDPDSRTVTADRPATTTSVFRDFTGAGKPPQAPWLWFATQGAGCLGDKTGWLSFNQKDRMTLGAELELHAGRDASDVSFSPLRACLSAGP